MAIKINGSNISQMRINGYDITLAKLNGDIVFQKLKLVKTFYGDSKQNTTTGKNKFDYFKTPFSESDSILNGATVLYNEDTGILSINNINKSGSATIKSVWKSNTNAQILPAGTYYIPFQFNITKVSGGGSQTSIGVNTFDSDVYLNQWFIVVDSGNIKNVVMQINEGDTQDTIFEPYTGGQPSPNPDYPQEVKSIISANLKLVGKNMVDFTDAEGIWNVDNITDGVVTSETISGWDGIRVGIKPFEVKANQTYYVSFDTRKVSGDYAHHLNNVTLNNTSNVAITASRSAILLPILSNDYERTVFSYTPSNDDVVGDIYIQRSGDDTNDLVMQVKNIMISTSTDYTYEPYKTGTIPINLQGNILSKVGDYADELQIYSNGDVKLVKKTREYKMTGNEDITNVHSNNLFDYQSIFNNVPYIPGSGLSNYYRYNPVQSGVNEATVHGEFALQHWMDGSWHNYNLMFKDTNHNNATNFKNHLAELYLAGTPVKVYYPLLNPSTIQLPNIKSDLDDFGEYSSMDIEVTYG